MSPAPEMTPPAPAMGADEPEPMDAPEEAETATVPIDFCKGMTPAAGQEYKVKVISVDEDSGTQTIAYSGEPAKPERGIKAATAEYE